MTRRRFDSSYDAPANALTPERMDDLLRQSEVERESARADTFVATLRDEHDLGHHGRGDPVRTRQRRQENRPATRLRANSTGRISTARAGWIVRHAIDENLNPLLVAAARRSLDGTIEPTSD